MKRLACPFLAGTVVSRSFSWLRPLLPLADRCRMVSSKIEFKFLFLVLFLFGDALEKKRRWGKKSLLRYLKSTTVVILLYGFSEGIRGDLCGWGFVLLCSYREKGGLKMTKFF